MKESGLILNQEILLSLRTRFEEGNPSSSTFSNSITRRRRSSSINSGELRIIFTINFRILYWSDDRWKACLAAGGGGAKVRYQYWTDISGIIIYFRALQGHSGRNLIDLSLQDNVVIQSGFFQHIYHVGCVFLIIILSSTMD